ncbi:RNA polymerase sigma-70 factor, ECF subfamily [Sphingobacterium nematocida]|uniref:RNA polymerase sigma-70 factor, ECF subfamily n=1 Tax=Sphingobacterium nematocida TaxID=1513896 RepID=A0A1T5BZG4_9SPHI|nr:sigma-70 family RNA polymerase sigma factor [Sphingobacterium nematocida]SKB52280.1 RNA polymerase sigma-70 factor, ECF subfamily [Sphingobacterium nematocida]
MDLFFSKDSKLVKGCKANKRQAQEVLYKLYYDDMLRLCFRYLRSDELAQEALNLGFLKVFQHIGTFDSKKGELGAWINTIMVRSCIDLGRKEARFDHFEIQENNEDVFMEPTVLDKLFAEDVLKLIRLLPVATQIVFNLSVIDGYSHKEIAEQLEISEGTSRWHLSEAKKQLRIMLTNSIIDNPLKNKRS